MYSQNNVTNLLFRSAKCADCPIPPKSGVTTQPLILIALQKQLNCQL